MYRSGPTGKCRCDICRHISVTPWWPLEPLRYFPSSLLRPFIQPKFLWMVSAMVYGLFCHGGVNGKPISLGTGRKLELLQGNGREVEPRTQSCRPLLDKKLIRRWDSERELSLRRHCTRTKNTIDSCINSAIDRFLQRRFTKFSEITQCNRHYAVQGHSRSPFLVTIKSLYTTSY